jgi:hypothetical protein
VLVLCRRGLNLLFFHFFVLLLCSWRPMCLFLVSKALLWRSWREYYRVQVTIILHWSTEACGGDARKASPSFAAREAPLRDARCHDARISPERQLQTSQRKVICAFSAAAGRCDAQIMICSDKIQGLPPRLWWPHFHLIKISFDGIRIFKTFLTTWLLLYWTNQISLLRFCYIPSNVHKLYRWCGLCLVKLYQSVMMVKLVLAGVMLDDETRSVVMFFVSNLASVITMTSLNDTYIWRHVTPNNALE